MATSKETAYTAQFESAELLTLGIVYQKSSRFAGGAYNAFLKKVDRFSERTLERKPAQALTRMAAAVRNFKVDSVSNSDLAWVAVGASL